MVKGRIRKPKGNKAKPAKLVASPSPTAFIEREEQNPLGGMTESELAIVASEALIRDSGLDANEALIAIKAVAKAIATRMANTAYKRDSRKSAVIIVSEHARDLGDQLDGKRELAIDDGSKPFCGRLWIASPAFASGYWLPLESDSSIQDRVTDLGIDKHPAMVFDPKATTPEVRFYPLGLAEPEAVHRFMIAQHTFTMDLLDNVMKRFHEANIKTPSSIPAPLSPWVDSRAYHPRKDVEKFLQGWLVSVLNVAFEPKTFAKFEFPGSSGRCDILLMSRHSSQPSTFVYHVAMELKVLRSFSSRGKTVAASTCKEAIAKGLGQAISYKNEHNAEHGLLCCFDMRKPDQCDGDSCFKPVRTKAQFAAIELRHYRLYGSAAELRGG